MWPGRRSPSPLGFGLMFLWSLVLAPGVATAKNILIYGPSMSAAGDGLDNEQTLAQAAGHTVTVVDGETWSGMSTSQFAAFDAIVFGDSTCSSNPVGVLTTAENNRGTWSAAVTGHVMAMNGTDPIAHQAQLGVQAKLLVTNGINFAASGPGTGLYVSLSCYYFTSAPGTPVPLLQGIGTFKVEGQTGESWGPEGTPEGEGPGCPETVTIVQPSHPAMAGLTNAGLSNWHCSIHEAFTEYPPGFAVLAQHDPSGKPYILAALAPNQPPFFDPVADQFVAPLNVAQTVLITGASPGSAGEVATQFVTLSATSNNPAIVLNPVVISGNPGGESPGDGSTRTLTYQTASNARGTATITVTARDTLGATFSRTFDITVAASAVGAVDAVVTNVNANVAGGPFATVVVTARPIDFTGDGIPDCYRFFPPRPAPSEPFNVIPSNADQTPEAPPWKIPDDTVEICNVTRTFTGVVDLSQWITNPGKHQTDFTYVSLVRDLRLEQPGGCPSGETCHPRIWRGVKEAGSFTFATGDKVAVKNTVTLKTFDLVTKASTSTRLPDIPARDFDILNRDFQAAALGAVKSTIGSSPSIDFSLLSTILGKIFDAGEGLVGTCATDGTGLCFAGQPAPAWDLIVVKFFDADTGRTVYVGDVRRPADFVNGIAVENMVITKLFKNGVFQGYLPGLLTHVD